jgi:hypothetical protein
MPRWGPEHLIRSSISTVAAAERQVSAMPRFSWQEAVGAGWRAAKANVGFFVIVFILAAVIGALPGAFQAATKDSAPLLAALFGLVGVVVGQVLSIGITKISLKFADGQKAEIADLWQHYRLFVPYFFTMVVYTLIVAAGLVLLIVPGIIWGVRFSQAPYLVVDQGVGVGEALRRSSELTQGSRWALFLFWMVLAGIVFLGFLALVVGLVVAAPTAVVAAAHVYRQLQRAAAPGAGTAAVPV